MRKCGWLALFPLLFPAAKAEPVRVHVEEGAPFLVQLAGAELVRYLDLTTQEGAVFGRGGAREIRLGVRLAGVPTPATTDAYRLRHRRGERGEVLLISGQNERAVLYGAYDLLERMGLVFTITEDILPPRRFPVRLPLLDEEVVPAFAVRGFLPWPDFLNGITAWDLADYQSYINQMLKLRMNTLMLHVYARTYANKNWSEPFLGFRYQGIGHHAFLDTSLTERWGYFGYSTDNFVWGSDQLFHRRAYGSEAAQFCPDQATIYVRAKGMLREVIAYARRHGLQVVLGFEINLIPKEIEAAGGSPFDEAVVRARLEDLLSNYPDVDCVQVWFSEFNRTTPEEFATGLELVKRILSELAPDKRITTGGWFAEQKLAALDALVAPDFIFSTLTPHKGRIDRAFTRMQAGRERWPVPWLEFDGNLWVPQPFVFGFRTTLQEAMEAGIEGVLGIHWRSNELDANFDYLARGLWGQLPPPSLFYRHFARTRYGAAEAEIAEVLIDLEQLDLFGKEDSPEYSAFRHFKSPRHLSRARDLAGLHERLAALSDRIPEGETRRRFRHLLDTLQWSAEFFRVKEETSDLRTWSDVLRLGIKESVETYTRRVTSAEELGTLAALTCKYYHDYRRHEERVRAGLSVQPPDQLRASVDGGEVRLTWRAVPGARPEGFEILRRAYPGGRLRAIGQATGQTREFRDRPGDGIWEYAAVALSATGERSPESLPDRVAVGKADTEPPFLLLTPRHPTAVEGSPVWLRLVARDDSSAPQVVLHFRPYGQSRWELAPLQAGLRCTYFAEIPAHAVVVPGVQFYFTASDGTNLARWPHSAPQVPYSVRVSPASGSSPRVRLAALEPVVASDYIGLAWSVEDTIPPAGYQVQRRRAPEGPWLDYARVFGGLSSFFDDEVEPGAVYRYRILPRDPAAGVGEGIETGEIAVPPRGKYRCFVNCAGRDYLDSTGTLWRGDHVYSALSGWGYVDSAPDEHWLTGAPIKSATREELYQSVRYSGSGKLHYRFDVPDGNYRVGLLLAEIFYGVEGRPGGPGTRVFSVEIEGKTLLSDFDPSATVGAATAVERVFPGIEVRDGRLDVILTAAKDFPALCALWIEQE